MAPSSATSSCTGRGPSRPHPMPRRSLLRQGTGGNAHALAPFPTAECADGATSKPAPAARAARRRGLPRTWPTSRRPWWARYPNWAAPRPRRQSKGGWGPARKRTVQRSLACAASAEGVALVLRPRSLTAPKLLRHLLLSTARIGEASNTALRRRCLRRHCRCR